jgi:hypothetical protein
MSAGQGRNGDLSHDGCGVFASGGWVFRHPEGGLREDKRKGERRVKSRRIVQTVTPNPDEPTVFMFWERGALRWQPCQRVTEDRRVQERRKGE